MRGSFLCVHNCVLLSLAYTCLSHVPVSIPSMYYVLLLHPTAEVSKPKPLCAVWFVRFSGSLAVVECNKAVILTQYKVLEVLFFFFLLSPSLHPLYSRRKTILRKVNCSLIISVISTSGMWFSAYLWMSSIYLHYNNTEVYISVQTQKLQRRKLISNYSMINSTSTDYNHNKQISFCRLWIG